MSLRHIPLDRIVIALALLVLAAEPVGWLLTSWRDPSYDSAGAWVFACCVLLFALSLRTKRQAVVEKERKVAVVLLLATAALRAAGEVLAIHVIGALALVVDVYALALLLGMKQRAWPLSPLWLSVLFALSLPLERLLQRMGGYGLQQLSSGGACGLLQLVSDHVECRGVRILIEQADVLVDLPCSGTRGALLLATLFAALMSWARPDWRQGVFGALLLLASAFAANTLRITLLALGLAYPERIGGTDVMAQPWHDLIGLTCFGIGALPLLWFAARYAYTRVRPVHPVILQIRYGYSRALQRDGWWLAPALRGGRTKAAAFAFLACALFITHLPGAPLDVSRELPALALPAMLNGTAGEALPLSPKELAYFTRYGGEAIKTRYGDNQLQIIRTTSPLRHLHAPDECLRGQGYRVEYGGVMYNPVPTALYKVTTPEGGVWRVAVTFTDGVGHYTSVAEAVWHWMQRPGRVWMAVERITPWGASPAIVRRWDETVLTALDLPFSSTTQLAME